MSKRNASSGARYSRTSRKPKPSIVRKSILQSFEDDDVDDPLSSTAMLPPTQQNHDLQQLDPAFDWGPDPDDTGMQWEGNPEDAPDLTPHANDAVFYSFLTASIKTRASIRTWRDRQQRAFDTWVYRIDDLVAPYLAVTRSILPSTSTWQYLQCECASPPSFHVLFVDFHDATFFPVRSCSQHAPELLIRAGTFPSTTITPRVAFSFELLRQFLSLQENTRIGAFDFARSTLQAVTLGTRSAPPSASWISRDTGRRPLRSAAEWLQALEQRCAQLILHSATMYDFSRPDLHSDDLHLSLNDLAERCPACFGGMLDLHPDSSPSSTSSDLPPSGSISPQVIVCLDGNFQHKRVRANDAVRRMPRSPTYFLSPRQLESSRARFEDPAIPEGPRTGCSSEVRAAVDGFVKTSKVDFDIGGVIGMTCRHGSPLVLVDVRASGEKHYYAFALIEALLDTCGEALSTLGVCYDIGCKLSVSPRLRSALARRNHSVKIIHAVSVFHVYGHDYDCQLKYSPRRMSGFGLTDGEALERLWSSLSDLVSLTRDMSEADRISTLSSRLDSLSRSHRYDLLTTFQRRIISIAVTRERETQEFLKSLPHLVQYTAQSVADAYSLTSSRTGLPARLSDFISDLIERRRQTAFDRDSVERQLSARRQANSRNRILDLSIPAKQLYLPLRNWHLLSAVIRGRHGQHSQDGTAKLVSSKSGSATDALAARRVLNAAIVIFQAALPDRLKSRLHVISEDALFLPSNLSYVQGLLNPSDFEDEPWVSDSVLAASMDTVSLLSRLDEEQCRIAHEVKNMQSWHLTSKTNLLQSRGIYSEPESSLFDMDRAAFVERELDWLDCTARVWNARLSKIEAWQRMHVASLRNQRANLRKDDHISRFDTLIAQYEALACSWSSWSLNVASTLVTSPTSDPNHVDTAAMLVDDEDDDDEDAQVHPLDRDSPADDQRAGGEDDDIRLATLLSATVIAGLA
ncbi:hypothetical protein CF319_g5674 [Tilletia indica]|nr:hypothetical protein CF319_g5674 [Tilletia indica]